MFGKPFASAVVSKRPLPVRKYTFPAASAAGPSPLIQIAGPFVLNVVSSCPETPVNETPLLGATSTTPAGERVFWSKAMTHPPYGAISQWDVQEVYIVPFTNSSAARSAC